MKKPTIPSPFRALPTALTAWAAILLLGLSAASCSKEVSPTRIQVLDSIRYYYPILQGEDIELAYRIANVGNSPLVITDIMPSCGCISNEDGGIANVMVLPGKEQTLTFTFRTLKYSGYTRHTIRLFGNIEPNGMATMTFEVVVVPPSNGTADYEERYRAAGGTHDWADPTTTYPGQYLTPKDVKGVEGTRSYFNLGQ